MDYCSAADVKSYLDITGAQYDTLLASIVTRASRFIDTHCYFPRHLGQETLTEDRPGQVDQWGRLVLTVSKPSIGAITAMSYRTSPALSATAVDLTKVETEDFRVRADLGLTSLRGQPIRVSISYTGGYASGQIPQDIVHAATVLAARMFKSKDAGWSDVVGNAEMGTFTYSKVMPREVADILEIRRRRVP